MAPDNAGHGAAPVIVIALDDAHAILQDRLFVFDAVVGR